YIRSALLKLWSQTLKEVKDPVEAWKRLIENQDNAMRYKSARGKGGFVRTTWEEIHTLMSAALIHIIQKEGPDRIFGFSLIHVLSMVCYEGGSSILYKF